MYVHISFISKQIQAITAKTDRSREYIREIEIDIESRQKRSTKMERLCMQMGLKTRKPLKRDATIVLDYLLEQ